MKREVNYITDPSIETARVAREQELLAKDYTFILDLERLYEGLSTLEIKFLYNNSPSFKTAADKLNQIADRNPFAGDNVDETNVVALFRALPEWQQKIEIARIKPELKAIIDADFDRFNALTPEEQAAELAGTEMQPAVVLTTEQQAEKDAAQAETDRKAAEERAAAVQPTEVLFDGVEKIGEGSYKLTVDPGDGTPVEIFYAATQAELFAKLRKSKANATKEIRRRKKALEITTDMKALEVEKVNYAPYLRPLSLTPDQIFQLTEDQKDPSKVLAATAQLRQASLTKEECDRHNEGLDRQRYMDGYNVGTTWLGANADKFYRDPGGENIANLQKIMGELNWGMTIHNLDLAYGILKDQGVLLDPPEPEELNQPITPQPAPVIPVVATVPAVVAPAAAVAVPVVPSAAPVPTTGGLPAAPKVLRPGSSTTGGMPTRRIESVSTASPALVLTAEEYRKMPAAEAKTRYLQEPAFKAALDELIRTGKV